MRLVTLECGHQVLASPGAHTVNCAVCKKLVAVQGSRA